MPYLFKRLELEGDVKAFFIRVGAKWVELLLRYGAEWGLFNEEGYTKEFLYHHLRYEVEARNNAFRYAHQEVIEEIERLQGQFGFDSDFRDRLANKKPVITTIDRNIIKNTNINDS